MIQYNRVPLLAEARQGGLYMRQRERKRGRERDTQRVCGGGGNVRWPEAKQMGKAIRGAGELGRKGDKRTYKRG